MPTADGGPSPQLSSHRRVGALTQLSVATGVETQQHSPGQPLTPSMTRAVLAASSAEGTSVGGQRWAGVSASSPAPPSGLPPQPGPSCFSSKGSVRAGCCFFVQSPELFWPWIPPGGWRHPVGRPCSGAGVLGRGLQPDWGPALPCPAGASYSRTFLHLPTPLQPGSSNKERGLLGARANGQNGLCRALGDLQCSLPFPNVWWGGVGRELLSAGGVEAGVSDVLVGASAHQGPSPALIPLMNWPAPPPPPQQPGSQAEAGPRAWLP